MILIHGIWMSGLELIPLARRLGAAGYDWRIFRYASLARPPAANADALRQFVEGLGLVRVHFIAHSLGGIVLADLFARWPGAPRGRVVLLGAPLAGSALARRLATRPWLRVALGRSAEQGLLGGAPPLPLGREIGAVAGTRGPGIGTLIGGLDGPADGTVAVSETRVHGLTDWIAYPVSHLGLLWSRRVARAVLRFLDRGRFGD